MKDINTNLQSVIDQECNSFDTDSKVGFIVIGRNEGDRLQRALSSIPKECVSILYVDSGSSDGSVEMARSMDIAVHCLDPELPFSPARARAEGALHLIDSKPDLDFLHFLDGDCEIMPDWLPRAVAHLKDNEDVAIVCGKLSEADPEASIYNKLSPLSWEMPTGEIRACGGIFIVRRDVYEEVGGFNTSLITREESDFCRRVKAVDRKIVRLDTMMAKHDSGLYRFGQWWARAVWGGYGDALSIKMDPWSSENFSRLRWYLTWPFLMPISGIVGVFGTFLSPWFIILVLISVISHGLRVLRFTVARLRQNDSVKDAMLYSFFKVIRSYACVLGFFKFFLERGKPSSRPDPHSSKV